MYVQENITYNMTAHVLGISPRHISHMVVSIKDSILGNQAFGANYFCTLPKYIHNGLLFGKLFSHLQKNDLTGSLCVY